LKKILAIIMLVVLLLTTATGCGMLKKAKDFKDGIGDIIDNIDNNDPDNGDVDDPDDPGDVPIFTGQVFYPQSYKDVINKFQEFGYIWTSVDGDGNSSDWSIYYRVEGTEEVDGVETQVISVTKVEGETNHYKFWFDDELNCVKALANEEEIDVWNAAVLTMLIQTYVNYVLLTTAVVDEDGMIDTFARTLETERTEGSDLGNMDVYEFSSNFSTAISTYGLIDFDGDLVYVLIKQSVEGSVAYEEMSLSHAVTR